MHGSKGNRDLLRSIPQMAFPLRARKGSDRFGYKSFAARFKAEKLNVGAWVTLFREYGARGARSSNRQIMPWLCG